MADGALANAGKSWSRLATDRSGRPDASEQPTVESSCGVSTRPDKKKKKKKKTKNHRTKKNRENTTRLVSPKDLEPFRRPSGGRTAAMTSLSTNQNRGWVGRVGRRDRVGKEAGSGVQEPRGAFSLSLSLEPPFYCPSFLLSFFLSLSLFLLWFLYFFLSFLLGTLRTAVNLF